jgi:thiamine kinase
MVDSLSKDSRRRLTQALSTWKDWKHPPASEPGVISQLGGYTNESFHVSDTLKDWVVRINSTKPDAGINRHNELLAIEAANSIGIAPGIAHNTNSFLVTEYLQCDKPTVDDLAAIGKLFNRIHALDVNAKPMDLAQHLSNYYGAITPDLDISSCYAKFSKLPTPRCATRVLCHQDMTLENLLKCDQQIFVIDWEFAHLSDPAYDLAVFSYTAGLTQDQFTLLLENYSREDHYAREEDNLLERITYYELFYALIEILWWFDRGKKLHTDIEHLHQSLNRTLSS